MRAITDDVVGSFGVGVLAVLFVLMGYFFQSSSSPGKEGGLDRTCASSTYDVTHWDPPPNELGLDCRNRISGLRDPEPVQFNARVGIVRLGD